MKKIILSSVAVLLASSLSYAADTLDGCGIGWQVNDGKTYTATTTRATTNMTIPPAFGMTTGTLGCDQLEIGQNEQKELNFVATNFEVLKTELAMGHGEYVDGLMVTMGCSSDVSSKLQSQYNQIVAAAKDARELHAGIRSVCAN